MKHLPPRFCVRAHAPSCLHGLCGRQHSDDDLLSVVADVVEVAIVSAVFRYSAAVSAESVQSSAGWRVTA